MTPSGLRWPRMEVRSVADPAQVKWGGWGDPEHRVELPEASLDRLRAALGAERRRADPVSLEDVQLDDPRLAQKVRDRLVRVVGASSVRDDRETRVLHAAGKGYVDLVRVRA